MTYDSPFTLRRFEHERTHLYYLPRDLFSTLEERKSTFLIGSRGTGKTTLLSALSWQEQAHNKDLIQKLDEIGASRAYIGLYIRMPQTLASAFDKWIPNANELLRGSVFCFYLDLVWIQSALEATRHLLLSKVLMASPKSEYALGEQLVAKYPELIDEPEKTKPLSLKRMARLLYEKRRGLERWVVASTDPRLDSLNQQFPLAQLGDFGRFVAEALARFCESHSSGDRHWHFKVCLDESECLSAFQQRALNTAVRLLQAHVSYVVSYVRDVDVTSTLIKGMSLQEADRHLRHLDGMGDADFAQLAEGVATVRIQKVLDGSASPVFHTREVLGTIDINELLLTILHSSASPEARKILRQCYISFRCII